MWYHTTHLAMDLHASVGAARLRNARISASPPQEQRGAAHRHQQHEQRETARLPPRPPQELDNIIAQISQLTN